MLDKREHKMGRFAVEFEMKNYQDVVAVRLGRLDPDKVRSVRLRGWVDTGASQLVVPARTAKQLGLAKGEKVGVRYADGRRATRNFVDDVYIEMLGRHRVFSAIVEPRREDALIGAIVLEAFDFLPDCNHQRLVPRDPRFVVSEIE